MGEDSFSDAMLAGFDSVPVVDLSFPFNATLGTILTALRTFGFFYIANHGVAQTLIDEQFAQSQLLFALPHTAKNSMPFNGTLDIGYLGSGAQALEKSGKKVAGGMHKFDADEVDVNGGDATADDFMDAFGF